jgi:hypothetical protein
MQILWGYKDKMDGEHSPSMHPSMQMLLGGGNKINGKCPSSLKMFFEGEDIMNTRRASHPLQDSS